MFGEGISMTGDILDLAASINVVNKSGAWYAYEGNKIGQGRENAKAYLKENPEICAQMEAKVREHFGLSGKNTGKDGQKEQEGGTVEPKPAKGSRAGKAETVQKEE